MSNPVFFLAYNRTPEQLSLSKEALASIFAQDIPVHVYAIDNGSTDETWEWMESVAKEHTNFTCYRNLGLRISLLLKCRTIGWRKYLDDWDMSMLFAYRTT